MSLWALTSMPTGSLCTCLEGFERVCPPLPLDLHASKVSCACGPLLLDVHVPLDRDWRYT